MLNVPAGNQLSALAPVNENHIVHVRSIEVAYNKSRPNYPIIICVTMDDDKPWESDAYKTKEEISWCFDKRLRADSRFTIIVYEVRKLRRKKEVVKVTVPVTEMMMKPVFVIDEPEGLAVSLNIHCETTGPFVGVIRLLVREAQGKLSDMKSLLVKYRKICEALNIIVSITEPLSDVHPAVSAAVSAATMLYERTSKMQQCHEAASTLMSDIESFLPFTEILTAHCKNPVTTQTIISLLVTFERITQAIITYSTETILGNLLDNRIDEVNGYRDEFNRLKETLDWCVKSEIWMTVLHIEIQTENLLLNLLRPVHSAFFDSKEACFEGTRKDTLTIIEQWYSSDSKVFWLHGCKGSGKTVIAHTVSKLFEDQSRLAGSFFFDGESTERHSLNRVIPTIAYQLAKRYRGYYSSILDVLNGHHELNIHTSLDPQLDLLLKLSLSEGPKSFSPPTHNPLVIVLDGFELVSDSEPLENDQQRLQILMAGFLRELADIAPWLKIYVGSRWNPSEVTVVEETLKVIGCGELDISDPYIDARHDVVAYANHCVRSDVRPVERYINVGYKTSGLLRRIRRLLMHPTVWVGDSFESSSSSASEQLQMEEQFRAVILGVMHGWKDVESSLPLIRGILAISHCIAVTTPLTEGLLMNFVQSLIPGTTPGVIHSAVSLLCPILTRDGDSIEILFPPLLFLDFVADEHRSGSFATNVKLVRSRMARQCLHEMDTHLRFNICGLESLYLPNKEVKDLADRVESCIPEMLRYSCLNWVDLVIECGDAQALSSSVTKILLSPKIFFWLEVLSVIGRFDVAKNLSKLIDNYKEHNDICTAAKEFYDFVSSSYTAMEFSAPHAYICALAWLPHSSFLSSHNLHAGSSRPRIIIERFTNSETTANCIDSEDDISSIACSLDGNRIVSVHGNFMLYIWDGRTGARVHGPLRDRVPKPFHEQAYSIWCVRFCLDGSRFVSASYDGSLRLWDALSGELISVSKSGSDTLVCVALSPDATRIVSGHMDGTIRIWNAETGDLIVQSSEHQEYWVRSVAYSPDGSRIVSGSDDKSLRIWDAKTGESIGSRLSGHTSWVLAVTYSPDCSRIVSASYDKTVRIWDAQTGKQLGKPLRHKSHVMDVGYSRDGSRILSSSYDETFCVWDSNNGVRLGVIPRNESRWDPERQCFVSIPSWWPRKRAPNVRSLLYSANPLYISFDGWIRTLDDGLLLWVPPEHRGCECHATWDSTITKDERDERISNSEWGKLVQWKDWARTADVEERT